MQKQEVLGPKGPYLKGNELVQMQKQDEDENPPSPSSQLKSEKIQKKEKYQLKSCLGNKKKEMQIRKDKYEKVIAKGGKKHKICFRDQIDKKQKINDIYIVENWKQYNVEEDNEKDGCTCCLIF